MSFEVSDVRRGPPKTVDDTTENRRRYHRKPWTIPPKTVDGNGRRKSRKSSNHAGFRHSAYWAYVTVGYCKLRIIATAVPA